LLAVTIADLKPDPQEKPTFYLKNIYDLLADGNVSRSAISVEPPRSPPPKYVIWVNSLWFLSLNMSLTSAMLATMLQQWARRYIQITEKPHYTPHYGARVRAFFTRGLERLHFSWAAEAIPLLIHMSLILFFTGLLIYLYNIHHTVFWAAACWIVLSAVVYLVITIMPVVWVDSPYYSPLSALVFRVYAALLFSLSFVDRFRILATKYSFRKGFSKSIENMAIEEVTKISESGKIDEFILKWTFDAHSMASPRKLDQFFSYIYDFSNSKLIDHPLNVLNKLDFREFCSAWMASMRRTFSLTSLSDPRKMGQFKANLKVADAIYGSAPSDSKMGLLAKTSLVDILADVPRQKRDDSWFDLAADQMDKTKEDIRRYANSEWDSDNVLLATRIHMAHSISKSPPDKQDVATFAAERTLQVERLSQFEIQNASPELRHEFCSLWNEIVPRAQASGDGSIPHFVIHRLRPLYDDLHRGTEYAQAQPFDEFKASSYCSCGDPRHRSREQPIVIPKPGSIESDISPVEALMQDNETGIDPSISLTRHHRSSAAPEAGHLPSFHPPPNTQTVNVSNQLETRPYLHQAASASAPNVATTISRRPFA
jgi:Family of unknown function (DUF6535)